MEPQELSSWADRVYGMARSLTRNGQDVEELAQETLLGCLIAIRRGQEIRCPEAFLRSILKNQWNRQLRRKYRQELVCFDTCGDLQSQDFPVEAALLKDEEAATIRRELSRLTKLYREVMVRFYVQRQSVREISAALGIPKGTVLSRLESGRRQVREGVESMQDYETNSFQPERLRLGINGSTGRGGSPFSSVDNTIKENILLLAYREPVEEKKLARALGMPSVFLEEQVAQLVSSELMIRTGKKVATDFPIVFLEERLRWLELTRAFAADTQTAAGPILRDMAAAFRDIDGMQVCADAQLYTLAALEGTAFWLELAREVTGLPTMRYEEFPERPRGGKWLAIADQFPHAFREEDCPLREYMVSGRLQKNDMTGDIAEVFDWDTFIGPTHSVYQSAEYGLKISELAALLAAFSAGRMNGEQAAMVPMLEEQGYLAGSNADRRLTIPILVWEEYRQFQAIVENGKQRLKEKLFPLAVPLLRAHPVRVPAHIHVTVPNLAANPLFGLNMAYVYLLRDAGAFSTEVGRRYPVMVMVRPRTA